MFQSYIALVGERNVTLRGGAVGCEIEQQHEIPGYKYTRSVRKVSDRIFLCEHLMDYNLARLHEPTLNLSAHA